MLLNGLDNLIKHHFMILLTYIQIIKRKNDVKRKRKDNAEIENKPGKLLGSASNLSSAATIHILE